MDIVLDLFLAGMGSLWEYLSAHVLLCLIPAFFISGAFSALIPDKTIFKYMGKSSSKSKIAIAYLFAATSGLVL